MAALVAITRREPNTQRTIGGWFERRFGRNLDGLSQWPVWVIDWDQPEHINKNLRRSLDTILDTAEPPDMVVASNDLAKEILVARQVTPQEMDEVKDWFAFLRLQRQVVDAILP